MTEESGAKVSIRYATPASEDDVIKEVDDDVIEIEDDDVIDDNEVDDVLVVVVAVVAVVVDVVLLVLLLLLLLFPPLFPLLLLLFPPVLLLRFLADIATSAIESENKTSLKYLFRRSEGDTWATTRESRNARPESYREG